MGVHHGSRSFAPSVIKRKPRVFRWGWVEELVRVFPHLPRRRLHAFSLRVFCRCTVKVAAWVFPQQSQSEESDSPDLSNFACSQFQRISRVFQPNSENCSLDELTVSQ